MIVSIQIPSKQGRNGEKYLRTVLADDAGVDEVRKAVTAMMRKPADYRIACKKFIDWSSVRKGPKSPPVIRTDDERVEELHA